MTKIKLYNLHEGTVYMGRFPENCEFTTAAKLGWKSPTAFKKSYPQFAHNYKDIAVEIKIPPLQEQSASLNLKRNQLNAAVLSTLNR